MKPICYLPSCNNMHNNVMVHHLKSKQNSLKHGIVTRTDVLK